MNIRVLHIFTEYIVLSNITTILIAFIEYLIIHKVDQLSLILSLLITILILYISPIKSLWKKINIRYNPEKSLIFSIIFVFYTSLLLVHLYITPVYPANPSGDFLTYSYGSLDIHNGKSNSLSEINDVAVYLVIASLYGLSKDLSNILFIGRVYILFLNIIAFLELYIIVLEFYGDYESEITAILFALLNGFWIITFFATGLYANTLGLVFTLYLLLYIIRYYKLKEDWMLINIGVITLAAVLSHTSSLLLVGGLLIGGLYTLLITRDYRLLKASLTSITVSIATIVSMPKAYGGILEFIFKYGFHLKKVPNWAAWSHLKIEVKDPIADSLGMISPFLKEAYKWNGFLGVSILLISIILGVYLVKKKENPLYTVLFSWIILIIITTVFLDDEWRFYPYSGYVTLILFPYIWRYIKKYYYTCIENLTPDPNINKIFRYFITFTVIILLIISSLNISLYIKGIRSTGLRYYQCTALNTFKWIKNNTPNNSVFISIARWEYMYLPIYTGRRYLGDVYMYPTELINYLRNELNVNTTTTPFYVIIWNKVNDGNNERKMFKYYENDDRFIKIYENKIVKIYKFVTSKLEE